ncbi:hypothetical protein FACS189444_3140 [Spirochaetia bacterium]|nr:hypothetical protein FACS189444_3140 [Spirochaetia bacterium]
MAKNKITITESGPVDAVPMDLVPAEQTLELKIIEEQVGFITTNAKDLLVLAKAKCAEYADLSRFDGDPDYAKKERAALNNAEKKAAEMAKEVTARWNAPLEEFTSTMKEVRAAFKETSQRLDVGIKEAEQKENERKTQAIQLYFDSKKFDLVPFERLFNQRWLLKLSKMPDIMKELDEKIEKIYKDLKIIDRIAGYEAAGKAFYLNTLDIDKALEEVDRLKEAAEKVAREKVEREEREVAAKVLENQQALRNEVRQEAKDEKIQDLAAEALEVAEAPEPEEKGPGLLCTSLRFKIKPDTYRDLRTWLSSRGVPYKTVSLFKTDEDAAVFMKREAIAGEVYAAVIH